MKLYSMVLCGMILLAACSKKNDDIDTNTGPNILVLGDPVETNPPNADYEPAFTGQTRIGSVKTTTPFTATVIATTLNRPWGMANLPDGRLLITEKAGTMRIATPSGSISEAITITGIPAVNSSGQGGLLGICLDPQFETNRMIYWVFSENNSGGTVTSVAKGKLSDNEASIENAVVIYRALPAFNSTAHYGGRILFDNSSNLLVSTGERSILSARPLAQSQTAAIGKIVRITTSGDPAPGNPTFSQPDALPELYSIGHRNPQGMALHPVTGDLWSAEMGPRGGDEINRIQAGLNYGWPVITYGIEYSGQPVGDAIQQKEGMEQPVYYWDPVISPSGICFYEGNRIPEWQNNLFIGALSGQHIDRLVISNNRVAGEERLLASENQRFRAVIQGLDGALYAITDAGRLYRIDRS